MTTRPSPLNYFAGLTLLSVATVGLIGTSSVRAQETQTYYCSPTETLLVRTIPGSPPSIEVTLPDQRVLVLPQDVSASGAKFTNGTVTVWSKGNTALVEENGEVRWQDCVRL